MKNTQIVNLYKIENNIPINEPLLTFSEWKMKGFTVKKGEKSHIKLNLWKRIKNTKEDDKKEYSYIMKTTALFTKEQVKEIR